jgi:hypothetical protein
LDGKPVEQITAFLFHRGTSEDPFRLRENANKCFEGYKLAAQGFLFDDHDPDASFLSVMEGIVARNPDSRRLIHPYIGGEEVNTSPSHQPHRFAINFGIMGEDEAAKWPELFDLVRQKVKPHRDRANRAAHRDRWWRYGETRPGLTAALAFRNHVLVCSRLQPNWALARVSAKQVFSERLDVITLDQYSAFAILQCRLHEVWARFLGGELSESMLYTPTDCFETFPFPPNWDIDKALEEIGEEYYQHRAELMVRNNEGLTKTYNRFNEKIETDAAILKLRELHACMDSVVLHAYGWTDLRPRLDFILDHEDGGDDEETPSGRERKKPWRYRWVDEDRDEVLARLLELNRIRAEEEAQSAAAVPAAKTATKRGRKSSKTAPAANHNLFEVRESTE